MTARDHADQRPGRVDDSRELDMAEALRRLDQLDDESRRREGELAALADQVPQAVSRVSVLRGLVGSWRDLLPGRRRPS